MKVTPSLSDYLISPVKNSIWSISQFPNLSTGKIWVGDADNRPVESDFSPLTSTLPFNYLFRGNEDNVATPYPTILLQNLPDLGVSTIAGLDLPAGKIWRGTDTNRPEESDALSVMEADILAINARFLLGHFVMNSGTTLMKLAMPNSQFLEDLLGLPGIAMVNIGGFITIAVPGTDYVTPTQLEDAISVLQDEIDVLQSEVAALEGQMDAIQAELLVINGEIDAIQAELVVINSEIAALQVDVVALQAAVAVLQDQVASILAELVVINGEIDAIQAELVVINGEIDAIQAELVVITGDIATLQAQVAAIQAELITIEAEIAALAAAIAAISIDIDIVFGDIDELQDEIDDLQNQIDDLRNTIISMEDQISDNYAQMIYITNLLFDDVQNLQIQIDNLRLNNIPADADVSIYNNRLIDVQDPINPQDAATMGWTEALVSGIPSTTTLALIGDVSGTGTIDEPIVTTLELTLDEIPVAENDVDIGGNKLTNVATAVAGTDAVNKDLLESSISSTDITLEGDVSGSGPIGSPIETTLNLTLDEIPTAASDVSIGGHKLTNLSPGVSGTDAVNKTQLTDAISSLDVTLEGFVEGGPAVGGVIETVRGPDCLLTNIPAGGDVDMGSYKIENLAMSSAVHPLEAVNAQFIWDVLNGDVYVEWVA